VGGDSRKRKSFFVESLFILAFIWLNSEITGLSARPSLQIHEIYKVLFSRPLWKVEDVQNHRDRDSGLSSACDAPHIRRAGAVAESKQWIPISMNRDPLHHLA
jgi:hypothetical protein